MLMQFFQQVGEQWRMAEEIRRMVQFRHLNLIDSFSLLGTFDVVFCRNVLIYFDQDTKIAVLNRLAKAMRSDAYLMLGAAETVVGLTTAFRPMADHRGVYVPGAPKVAQLAAAS
jgi:chemotaxis protein methyltransferase CheR